MPSYWLVSRRLPVRALTLIATALSLLPQAYALPSFARQTGQKCAACHVGGSWPQLTPWGRFFKLSGYTAGKPLVDREGFHYVPVGMFGQAGLTWAQQPNNTLGQPVITQNGTPEAYQFTGEIGTGITDFLGVFYEYGISNTFPGWKGAGGPADVRAVHFFHPGDSELLVGLDSNNDPTGQDVWNSVPAWGYPFYGSPQAPGAPASPMITSLAAQAGSVGVYALLNRQWYAEVSMYRVATQFFRWMSAGTSFQAGGLNYLQGFNPYWRAYWTKESGPNVVMVGTFGMHSNVYPNSATPGGPTDVFSDYGFDSQYQHLGETHKVTLRGAYIYENQSWNGSFPLGASSSPNGNLKTLNLNGSYAYRDRWTFSAAFLLSNGSSNAAFYGVYDPSGTQITAKPNTSGYVLEVDRLITQNVEVMLQYRGFAKFNGLKNNIDGMGRTATDNNTLWLSVFFAF
ncbi:MAG: hypothetical protein JOY54_01350 [Acidobacteriaceae bacterium]|nr:hypothetical protein [Acidobacteriaceae bacterium]